MDFDQRLAELRVDLLEQELARQKAPKSNAGFWSNPLLLAIVGATSTAIAALVTNQLQLNASRQLERDKLESSLILKAVESESPAQRMSALQFLVKAGLLTDDKQKIATLKADDVPQIQPPRPASAPADASLQELILRMNAADKASRLAAVEQLVRIHAANASAVESVLASLDPQKLDALSASGRINVLVFLRNTNEVAWTPESIQRAEQAIDIIRKRRGQGIAAGPETVEALDRLAAHLAKIKS